MRAFRFIQRINRILFLGLFCLSTSLFAQSKGKIAGTITDANSGEALPGVSIVIKGTYMGASTDVDGNYFIVGIPVGTYEVEALYVGFKTITKTGVEVNTDRITEINFELVEAVFEGEAVIVVAEKDVIKEEVANNSLVISPVQLEEAAGVNTINDFLGAQAGVTDQRHLTIRGGSADQTGSLVNGISFVNQRIGKANATIPLSAVEEIAVQTGGFNAEYGNYRSGLINITTKAGNKDEYHLSFDVSRNDPRHKRFGKSLYDPTNYFLLTFFDPVLAFKGSNTDQKVQDALGYDLEAAKDFRDTYTTFRGWNELWERYNRGIPETEYATSAMDFYLWNAWMHQIVPDFAKLEELYPELTTENPTYNDPNALHYQSWENIKKAIKDHAHEKEGNVADYNIDFGFGGPIPFIGKSLGNATFHLSHKSTFFNYVMPVMRDGEKTDVTLLTIQSNISQNLKAKFTGLYRFLQGTQPNFPTNGDIPDLDLGGDTMPVNNVGTILGNNPGRTAGFGNYAYHPTFWQPKDQTMVLAGLTLDYTIDNASFLEFKVSYGYQWDYFEPKETRDHSYIINFGPFYMNEMPYGINFGPVFNFVHFSRISRISKLIRKVGLRRFG
jgi:hypothetical protein